jgi:hypothetical protein
MKSSSKPTEKRSCRDSDDNTTQTYIKRKETKKSGR